MSRADFLPFRQIHLDFHTSETIDDVGADFDPDEFAATLVKAHVNSITCFARCHHGWLYYPSQANPERIHPHLARPDLLRDQIEACHARGIRVPIYTTVQWDHFTARQHPEWLLSDEQGRIFETQPFEAGFYRWLNVNSPYVDFLRRHVRELFDLFAVDGFFFDIVQPVPSCDPFTQTQMRSAGLDSANGAQRNQFALDSLNRFKREFSEFVWSINPNVSIFYNAGHVGTRHRAVAAAYSHWELETLPSGGWGYQHFPVTMRYARTLGRDVLGQTGKFHTSWGDFHSFKNPAALQFECFRMLALGAKCMVGDQLHPRGRIDPHVYDLVGGVYAEVEAKEPWCVGARAVSEIGVLTPEEFTSAGASNLPAAIKGANRLLEEAGHQFDILDSQSDFAAYRVLILPDAIAVDEALAAKLQRYVAGGGKLIASFEAGLLPDKSGFAAPLFGVQLVSDGPRDGSGALARGVYYPNGDYVDYLLPQGKIGRGLPPTEHVMYQRGLDVRALPGAEVLAPIVPSYFDRTWEHFCSHRQTPSAGAPGNAGIVRSGDVIYFSNPIFTLYDKVAPLWCKRLLLNALEMLLPDPLLRHDGPSTLLAALSEQPAHNRRVLHLLHYIPERRGTAFDTIEDVIPLHDVGLSLRCGEQPRSVTLEPAGEALAWRREEGRLLVRVPKVMGHQMVVVTSE